MRSVSAPEFGVEQQQHGIELQSACQHVEHEDDLGGQGHVSEVGGGPTAERPGPMLFKVAATEVNTVSRLCPWSKSAISRTEEQKITT